MVKAACAARSTPANEEIFSTNRTSVRYRLLLCWSSVRPGPAAHSSTLCKEGRIVNKFALAAVLALAFGGVAHAKVIELAAQPAVVSVTGAAHAGIPPTPARLLPSNPSELPEPEVFAMMLVGLVLIGYRTRRDSSEPFE